MTEEERNQTGKYSDDYQNELAYCLGIVLLACVVVFCVAKLVALLGA